MARPQMRRHSCWSAPRPFARNLHPSNTAGSAKLAQPYADRRRPVLRYASSPIWLLIFDQELVSDLDWNLNTHGVPRKTYSPYCNDINPGPESAAFLI